METLPGRDVFRSYRKLHRAMKFAISLVVVERIERTAACSGEKKKKKLERSVR